MRITEGIRDAMVQRSLTSLSSRNAEAAQRASSGRRINAPSDDPVAAAELAKNRMVKARHDGVKDATTAARGDIELAEGVLSEGQALFQRAHEIALQAGNGSLSADERADLATEVAGLREQLISIANTKGNSGYLFGGSKSGAAPFSAAGAFSGDDTLRTADFGTGVAVTTGVSGASAFTAAGGRDVFADLTTLQNALAANDPAAATATLSNLETSRQQMMRVQADAGLKLNKLDATDAVVDRMDLSLAKRDHEVGDADPFVAYSDLTTLGQALEQAVGVARKVLDLGSLYRL